MTVERGNLPGSDFESPCYGEQTAAARRGKAATSGPAAVKRTVGGEPSTEECGDCDDPAAAAVGEQTAHDNEVDNELPGIRASPAGYWVGAERDLGCKNLGPQSVSSCRSKSLHDCDRRPVTILGSGPLMDDDGAMVCNDPAASAVGEQTTHDNKVGSRDICCNYYTRFSHRARDDVWPGAVDSTQAASDLLDKSKKLKTK